MKRIIVILFYRLPLFAFGQNALNIDGVDDHVETTFTGISGTSARTVECWIKTTAISIPGPTTKQNVLVDWGSASPLDSRFTFNLLWSNSIRIEIGGEGLSGSTAVNDGEWHHVAVVYKPSAAFKFKLYIDGSLETTGNLSQSISTIAGPVRIGRRADNVNYFDGSIDNVRIWNVVLSNSEIAQYGDSTFCNWPNGLVAFYDFNEGIAGDTNTTVTTLPELISGANGTLNNFGLVDTTSNWVNGVSGLNGGLPNDSSVNMHSCGPMQSPSGNTIWDTSGVYTDTLVNAFGCDSILTVDLEIEEFDPILSSNGTKISVQDPLAVAHQWLDCDNGYAIIPGATNSSFTPFSNGNYAAELSSAVLCVDTTDCMAVTTIGVSEYHSPDLLISPNPAHSEIHLNYPESLKAESIIITDIRGRSCYSMASPSKERVQRLEIDLPSGTYFLQLVHAEGGLIKRFIVQ